MSFLSGLAGKMEMQYFAEMIDLKPKNVYQKISEFRTFRPVGREMRRVEPFLLPFLFDKYDSLCANPLGATQ
ncbi:hypothetical protein [Acidovorax sp. SUPP2825]|uniref:hypothetical protein n=1 Tax=Acidovorax sp. SUPP2825 TaxID=2920879 RepID=UPI0023DE41CA|nr:hypothetical protein [Acidovorax sp. SUPP2825]GKS93502.1 hypothetical protein AVAK2825_03225 [Acidovorax sp. SUPP2825]